MMGVYAVMAYSVGQQTHDFGVRLAMAAAGAGIGLAIAAIGYCASL